MDENPKEPISNKSAKKILKDLNARKIPYECRVRTITKEKILEDGTKVTRTYTKVNDRPDRSEIYRYPQHMQGHAVILGNDSYRDQMSPRKHPRICNNAHKYTRRTNGKVIQVKPLPFRTLTKEAIKIIKEGMGKMLYDSRGFISKYYLKTVMRLPGIKEDVKLVDIPELSKIGQSQWLKVLQYTVPQEKEIQSILDNKVWITAIQKHIYVKNMSTQHILNTIKCWNGEGKSHIPSWYLGGKEKWLEIFNKELNSRN